MNCRIPRGKMLRWAVLATSSLLVMRLFFVQQLIAAFLIFSLLFAGLAVVALLLFALDFAWQTALSRAEAYVMVVGRSAGRGGAPINNSAVAGVLTPVLAHRATAQKQNTLFQ